MSFNPTKLDTLPKDEPHELDETATTSSSPKDLPERPSQAYTCTKKQEAQTAQHAALALVVQ